MVRSVFAPVQGSVSAAVKAAAVVVQPAVTAVIDLA
jgi:hypothetical protein